MPAFPLRLFSHNLLHTACTDDNRILFAFHFCLRFYSQQIKCMLGQIGHWVLLFILSIFSLFFFLLQHTKYEHDFTVYLHLTHLIHHFCCYLWMLECLEISTILYINVCMRNDVWSWHKHYIS